MITATVRHPRTGENFDSDFYITEGEAPILGIDACRRLDMLRIVEENICEVHESSLSSPTACLTEREILAEYGDLFEGLGLLEGDVHLETDPAVPPVQMPLRRLPIGVRDKVAIELQTMEAQGIITPVTEPSAWVSALLVVAKPDGKIRICIDPKPLNKALKRAHFCMPTIDDVLSKLSNAKVFTTCDVANAFWSIRLDDESSKLTTFETPNGRYRWLRMPFGISPAPEIFQARMHEALAGLNGVNCIADDVLISGSGANVKEATVDHNRNLRAFLQRCREKGIKLNRSKLQLNRESMVFCGHELTQHGVRPDQRKVAAVLEMPPPTDKQGVMRLLGLATYLCKFCPNFSTVTAPIRALLQKDNEFCWKEDVQGIAFEKLKEMLVNAPVLAYFDSSKPTVVQADASQTGIGAVQLCDGRPVEYVSRAMTQTEQQWAQIERELLSIVFAMERFHQYVFAHHVTVETDHKPLLAIVKKALSSAPKRLQRMLLRLQRYTFQLTFKPGSELILADTLSRAFPPGDTTDATDQQFAEEIAALADREQMSELRAVASESTISLIQSAAETDDEYQQLINQIAVGWPSTPGAVPKALQPYITFADELTVSAGLVFKGNRVVIPRYARREILERIHSYHIGVNGCIRRAREAIYFPGMTAAIKDLVSQCHVCVQYQNEQQKEPLMSHTVPHGIWQKVGTDICSFHGQDYLITVDYLSRYFEVDRLPTKRLAT